MLTTHLPLNVEVKNEWSYTSTPLICLHGVDRVKFTILKPEVLLCLSTQV
jgi:hypothetical protein